MMPSQVEELFGVKGSPSTYLHAGASKGWPHDPRAEDAFDLPPLTPVKLIDTRVNTAHKESSPEYVAEKSGDGAILLLYTPAKIIGRFDTFADATLAAQALNEMKGY